MSSLSTQMKGMTPTANNPGGWKLGDIIAENKQDYSIPGLAPYIDARNERAKGVPGGPQPTSFSGSVSGSDNVAAQAALEKIKAAQLLGKGRQSTILTGGSGALGMANTGKTVLSGG